MKRHRNISNNQLDYIIAIIQNIEKNIIIAAEKNNDGAFVELTLFIRDNLIWKSLNRSVETYEDVVSLPSRIYGNISNDYRQKLLDIITIRYTENIAYVDFKRTVPNTYLRLTYIGLFNLFHETLNEATPTNFNHLASKLKQNMFTISDNKEVYYYYSFVYIILFWLFYLNDNNKVNIKDYNISLFENAISNYYDNAEELVNIFFEMVEDAESNKWHIQDWDIRDYPMGEAYFVLSPSTWTYFGFTILLFKFNILDFSFEQNKIKPIRAHKFALDNISKNINLIELHKEKWFDFLYPHEKQDKLERFYHTKAKVLDFFNLLKKEQELQEFREISKIPLSPTKIEEFAKNVGKTWDSSAIIPTILKHFSRVRYVPNVYKKDGIGIFTTFLKARFAFIDGDKYQSIIGLSDFGSQTGQAINREFFNSIMNKFETENLTSISAKNSLDTILNLIEDKENTLIFTNWILLDKLQPVFGDIQYINDSSIPFCRMKYKNYPVINNHQFRDYIFIIDVGDIDYTIYQKQGWYNNELLIEVTEPNREEIITETQNRDWSGNDGIKYSDEEIEVLEKNSVYIKVLFKHKMVIRENAKIRIIKVTS